MFEHSRHDPLQAIKSFPHVRGTTLDALLASGASFPSWLTFDGSVLTAEPELSDVGSWEVTLTASHPISAQAAATTFTSPLVVNINVDELEFTSVASECVVFPQGSSPTATPFGPQAKLQPRHKTSVVKWPVDDLLTDSELEDILDCIVADVFEANSLA